MTRAESLWSLYSHAHTFRLTVRKKDTYKCLTTCITHKLIVTFRLQIVVGEVVKCDRQNDQSVAAACRAIEPLPHAESPGK